MAAHQDNSSNTSNPLQQAHQIIDTPLSPISVTPLAPSAQTPIHPSTEDTSTDPHSAVFKAQSQLAHRSVADAGATGAGERDGKEDSWKPRYGRAQSWDHQDWKRALQMGVSGAGEKNGLAGFTENGRH